jgi:hypothetical protein
MGANLKQYNVILFFSADFREKKTHPKLAQNNGDKHVGLAK